jgi:hypothetical protein
MKDLSLMLVAKAEAKLKRFPEADQVRFFERKPFLGLGESSWLVRTELEPFPRGYRLVGIMSANQLGVPEQVIRGEDLRIPGQGDDENSGAPFIMMPYYRNGRF